MKPVQMGLLVLAGALAGVIYMKVAQRPQPVAVTAPAPVPATPAITPAPAPPVEAAAPSPFPEKQAVKKAEPSKRQATSRPPKREPVTIAQNQPPAAEPQPAAAPQPEPAQQAPAPAPAPAPEQAQPAPQPVQPPPPPPPPPTVTLNAGTILSVRLVEGLSSDRNQPGDTFSATLDTPLVVDGFVIAERGARVEGRVVDSAKAGRVKGTSSLGVVLTRLHTSDGQHIAIKTDTFTRQGAQSRGSDAAKVGGAAAVGAIIGAIAGGGKGAAIGAGAGGAAGTGGVLLTRGKPAVLPSETHLNFRLSEPVTLTERPGRG